MLDSGQYFLQVKTPAAAGIEIKKLLNLLVLIKGMLLMIGGVFIQSKSRVV